MVSDLLTVTPGIAQLISAARTRQEIKGAAVAQGMVTLTENALNLARTGKTSLERGLHRPAGMSRNLQPCDFVSCRSEDTPTVSGTGLQPAAGWAENAWPETPLLSGPIRYR